MRRKKPSETQKKDLPAPGKRYPGVRGKIVDWAEHIFEEGMLFVRVRFTDETELCWTLQTAHVILEADLSDWKNRKLRTTETVRRERKRLGITVVGNQRKHPRRSGQMCSLSFAA